MLAGSPAPLELEAERLRSVFRRHSPGRYSTGADLTAGRVQRLHSLPGQGRRASQRLPACRHSARDLRPPVGQVAGNLELDRDVLDPTELAEHGGELPGPATGLAAEDRLQRLALPLIGALVDEQAHRHLGAGPDVALEVAHPDQAQAVQPHIAVLPLADVPSEDSLAVAVARRLGKGARARDVALADIEPVAPGIPPRNFGHGRSLLLGCALTCPGRAGRARTAAGRRSGHPARATRRRCSALPTAPSAGASPRPPRARSAAPRRAPLPRPRLGPPSTPSSSRHSRLRAPGPCGVLPRPWASNVP